MSTGKEIKNSPIVKYTIKWGMNHQEESVYLNTPKEEVIQNASYLWEEVGTKPMLFEGTKQIGWSYMDYDIDELHKKSIERAKGE